ncbi:Octicosapeptide/Phox/Bem1p family protein [Striga hermonthica]|uniref:Octicosapeptide/Phox/Bem1p family protein n=1 Tax=Striga hermonthica TaxID=68872 RepID=A0A9N7R0X0_STRHE|nr:Octicosapeptide/Phox/Bem1p family protein [Striga hermonthica]
MESYSYNASYPESGGSSPRSREIDFENPPPWEESSQGVQPPANYRVKFMCSYGGRILPRPNDNQLSYVGGETKILAVDRGIRFAALFARLSAMCDGGEGISFKYQLPGEDLDALISVTNDDDLEHMMHEYERLWRASPKPARLRIFIFQAPIQSLSSSTRSFGSDEVKSEKERFVEALNSAPITAAPPRAASPSAPHTPPPTAAVAAASKVDFLFGLEKASAPPSLKPIAGRVADVEDPIVAPGMDEPFVGLDPIQKHIQDLQRLRLEEQHHRRKSDDNLGGMPVGGEYYRVPERLPPAAVHGGVPYWAENQVPGGFYAAATTVNKEQPVYIVPPPSSAYHAPPVARPLAGVPAQGYYAVSRMPTEIYRDQQPQLQMHNMVPQAAGYTEGFGMVPQAAGYTEGFGMVTQAGYSPAYDGGLGRQVVYAAPGGVMGAPVQMAAQYQATAGVDVRQSGPVVPESAGKGVVKVTQTSV